MGEAKNSNTLLWLAVIGLGVYVWYTRHHMMVAVPGGYSSGSASPGGTPIANQATATSSGTVQDDVLRPVPVTITSQTMAGTRRLRTILT